MRVRDDARVGVGLERAVGVERLVHLGERCDELVLRLGGNEDVVGSRASLIESLT